MPALKSLVGRHILSGIETGEYHIEEYPYGAANYIKFTLDGITYMAKEDPDDDFRSYLDGLDITEKPCLYQFPGIQIICRMVKGPRDVLEMIDYISGREILVIGTDYTEPDYPVCIFRYKPENASCNIKGGKHE